MTALVLPARRVSVPTLTGALPIVLVVAMLTSWLLGRLAVSWAVGAVGAVFILVRGRRDERLVVIGLVLLSLIAGGEQTTLGLRGVLFASTFIVVARYVEINAWMHLAAQLVALTIALASGSETGEIFLFGPSILCLIVATEELRNVPARPGSGRRLLAAALNLGALALPGVGYGSRSALFAWVMVNARKLKLIYLIALGGLALLAVPIVLSLRDVPVIEKLGNSVTELSEPIDPETGGVSQRAYENLLFVGYVAVADTREMLLGSTLPIYLDGEPLGQDKDVHFIPHNQIFGTIFQFGFVGTLLILYYLIRLVGYFNADPFCSFLLVILLLSGFILKAGFYDGNLALLAGTLNWVRRRQIDRIARGSP